MVQSKRNTHASIVFTPTQYSAEHLLKGMPAPESLKFVCAISLFLDIIIGYRVIVVDNKGALRN